MTDSTNSSIKMPIRRMNVDELDNNTTALFNTQRTNCITEIPQDIKLELLNGELKLLAGSKVYVPRTNNEFLEVTISEDLSYTYSDASVKPKLFYNLTTNRIFGETNTGSGSGINPPQAYYTYYNTSLNVVRRTIDGSTWLDDELSLPLCDFIVAQGTGITSIDKVFNGFGYIGSTIFALPGVKGLIPNGWNGDGTLKHSEFTNRKVATKTATWSGNNINIGIYDGWINLLNDTDVKYDPLANRNYNVATGADFSACFAGKAIVTDLIITSFTPKTTFHAVDRNDSSWLSGLGMPSNKYIDLTLGSSDSTYTAPANGYFTIGGVGSSSTSGYVVLICDKTSIRMEAPCSNALGINLTIPVKKGDEPRVSYAYYSHNVFRFVYAEGEQ